jgi:CelD/BcsL family acetyltransferase involved in cellulose biosynthesis
MLSWRVEEADVDGALGSELESLWLEARCASPFAAPSFLRVMLGAARPGRGLLALGRRPNGSLAALWPLRLSPTSRLELVQGPLVDHCASLSAADVTPEELGGGLAAALEASEARGVFLGQLPSWGPTLAAARAGLAQAGWRFRAFAASPCPVLALAPGPGLAERWVAEANRHRRVRGYANRLQRQPGFALEVFEDSSDLEGWAWDFFDVHEWRWNPTSTPSQYRFRERREFVLSCLEAWQRDGLLVRFSIRLREARLALVGALRAQDRLVYHLVVTSPAGAPHRAGHVLVRLILLWLAERGLPILDFGIGDEDYKLRYANRDEKLWRVYGSRSRAGRSYLVGSCEARIRSSARLQAWWDEWANRRIRGTLFDLLRRTGIRLRRLTTLCLAVPAGEALGQIASRILRRPELFYRARGVPGPLGGELVALRTFDALEVLGRERGLLPAARAEKYAEAYEGARAFAIRGGDRVLHLSWLGKAPPELVPDWFDGGRVGAWHVRDPMVVRTGGGPSHESRALRSLLRVIPPGDWLIVSAPGWDRSSLRSLAGAGFAPYAVRRRGRRGAETLEPWGGRGEGPA